MSITVSFIIPCLNSEKTISQTLDSIFQQVTDLSFEVIVVDNGSSDQTVALATRDQVKVLHCEKRGAGCARNHGAQQAAGAFLAFIDSDVVLDPQWLATLMARLIKENFSIALGRVIPAGEKSFFNDYRLALNNNRYRGTNISLVHPLHGIAPTVNTAACIYRKNVFKSIGGFNEELSRLEDSDLSMRIFFHGGSIIASSEARAWVYNTNGILSYLMRSFKLGIAQREFSQALGLPKETALNNYKVGFVEMARSFPTPELRLFHYVNLGLSLLGFCLTAFRPPMKTFKMNNQVAKKIVESFSFQLEEQDWRLSQTTRLIVINESWHFLDAHKVIWHQFDDQAPSRSDVLTFLSNNKIIEPNRG